MFLSHGTVMRYLMCVLLVYRRWIYTLTVVGKLRNVGVPWLVGAMAVVYLLSLLRITETTRQEDI